MLILPDRNMPRARILMPVYQREWRTPSLAQPKDQFGQENRTRFQLTSRLHDGHIAWRGYFDDRTDADAFFYALVSGSLSYERELWRLPKPWWCPDYGDNLSYELATLVSLTGTPGTNAVYTSPSDWNNSNNFEELIGGGASGGAARTGGGTGVVATGGGAGQYAKIVNFVFATPGTTTATYNAGNFGAATTVSSNTGTNGASGTVTYFNATSDPGAGSDNTKAGAKPGILGLGAFSNAALNGGAGGTGGWGQTLATGGRGGNSSGTTDAASAVATGAGGAAGLAGAGNQGVDTSSTTSTSTNGGRGDVSSGGLGGTTGGATGGAGAAGTEFDASHGSGGGGAGGFNAAGTATGGAGGLYGSGGGAAAGSSGSIVSGVGKQGMIFITYTVATVGRSFGFVSG